MSAYVAANTHPLTDSPHALIVFPQYGPRVTMGDVRSDVSTATSIPWEQVSDALTRLDRPYVPAATRGVLFRLPNLPQPFIPGRYPVLVPGSAADPYCFGVSNRARPARVDGLRVADPDQIFPGTRAFDHFIIPGVRSPTGDVRPIMPDRRLSFEHFGQDDFYVFGEGTSNWVASDPVTPTAVYRVSLNEWEHGLTRAQAERWVRNFHEDTIWREVAVQTIEHATLDRRLFIEVARPIIRNAADRALLHWGIARFQARTAEDVDLNHIQLALDLFREQSFSDNYLTTLAEIKHLLIEDEVLAPNAAPVDVLIRVRQFADETLRRAHVFYAGQTHPDSWISMNEMQRTIDAYEAVLRHYHPMTVDLQRTWQFTERFNVNLEFRRRRADPARLGTPGDPYAPENRAVIGLDPNPPNATYSGRTRRIRVGDV